MTQLLELKQITCRFPGGIIANQNINFEVKKGEVHALIGENGAGKSTLMKVAFGMQQPTSGTLYWKGKEVTFTSVAEAMGSGIGMVHQHFMLIPSFTVWENIVLGHEPTSAGQLAPERARQRVKQLSEQYGLKVDPNALVAALSVGEQQRVEILKSLYRDISLLILDEPTAVLTPQETEELFSTLRQLVADGLTIIFISHKLREVKSIANRLTILRKGQKVAEGKSEDFSIEELATEMVGRPLNPPEHTAHRPSSVIALEAKELQIKDNRGLLGIKGISFALHQGEILGIAGVEGNGQSELLEALAGRRKISQGQLLKDGTDITHQNVRQRFEQGIAHIPADRQRQGLVMSMTVLDNLLLGRQYEEQFLKQGIWINQEKLREEANEQLKTFEIEPPKLQTHADALSGGNQQKVVIAREFCRPASVYLIAHPTRGVDIGAIEAIHTQLLDRQSKGAAILLLSSELPELLTLCDKIAVLYEGQFVAILDASETSETELGIWMTGGTPE